MSSRAFGWVDPHFQLPDRPDGKASMFILAYTSNKHRVPVVWPTKAGAHRTGYTRAQTDHFVRVALCPAKGKTILANSPIKEL